MAGVDTDFSRRRGHRRYQSMMAQQFSTQLDDVFNMDKGLDTLVHDVESKRQSVFIQQRELEELQERIRAAEAALGTTTDEEDEDDDESDDSESDSATGTGKASATIEAPRARGTTFSNRQPSIFAIRETKDEEELPKVQTLVQKAATPAPVPAPGEYVMVRRPRPGMKKHPRVDSAHIEVSSEEEEEDDDEDDSSEEDDDDNDESSEEE